MTKLYTQKYRLYPNKEQQTKLAQMFGCVRWVYNNGLSSAIKEYQEDNSKKFSYVELANRLPQWKKEFPWLKE